MLCKIIIFYNYFRIKDFTTTDENVSIVFVEGQFIFRDQRIRDMLDMKIFIEVDADVRLSRLGKFKEK